MIIREQLANDLKAAMRARDEVRLRTIRSLRAALQAREIELRQGGVAELTEEQEQAVLHKQAKQRRDAIEQYQAAGRIDLVQKEREELKIIEGYLPGQLSDEEIRNVLQEVITSTGATSSRDIGKVMGVAMQRLRGRADGRRINEMIRLMLTD